MVDICMFYRKDSPERERNFNLTVKQWTCGELKVINPVGKVIHRTKMFNDFLQQSTADYVIWVEADILLERSQIDEMCLRLRQGYVMVYPYDGFCWNVPESYIGERQYVISCGNWNDLKMLSDHVNEWERFCPFEPVAMACGGVFGVNRKAYLAAGGENEYMVGWGSEDFERFYRLKILELPVYHCPGVVYHLPHPRIEDVSLGKDNQKELDKVKAMTRGELRSYVNSWPWKP